jgi:hypothetical protein
MGSRSRLVLSSRNLPTPGLVKSWSCTSCAFIPISLRRFPPLAKGGLGGVVPARPVTRSSHALSLSVLSHPSREARRIVLDFQGSRITPPTPPSQGGERDRSLATSFHRAQQKHASRNRPSSSVNTNFSPAQPTPPGVSGCPGSHGPGQPRARCRSPTASSSDSDSEPGQVPASITAKDSRPIPEPYPPGKLGIAQATSPRPRERTPGSLRRV